MSKKTLVAVFAIAAAIGAEAVSEVTVAKPYVRWLWGGFCWQHCEATFASHMSDEFRDERAVKDGVLAWKDVADGDHAYYRVFRDGRQIALTVATSCRVTDEKAAYSVVSVDRWGNVGREGR